MTGRAKSFVRFYLPDDQWSAVKPSPDTGKSGLTAVGGSKLRFVTLTAYEEGLPVEVAYPKPPKLTDIAGDYLSRLGLRQFRCAETEKYPHVTFFFNDYRRRALSRRSPEDGPSAEASRHLRPQAGNER